MGVQEMILKLSLAIKITRAERTEDLSGEVGFSIACGGWRSLSWQRFDCDVGVRVGPPVACLQFPGEWRGGAGDPRVQPGTEQRVIPRQGRLRTLYRLTALLITFR